MNEVTFDIAGDHANTHVKPKLFYSEAELCITSVARGVTTRINLKADDEQLDAIVEAIRGYKEDKREGRLL